MASLGSIPSTGNILALAENLGLFEPENQN